MNRLWIVRHGNCFGANETPRRIGARTDVPLVESGRSQAGILARWFEDECISFDRVFSSPLSRTRETALVIAGRETSIELCDCLAEIDHGPDEDRPEAEVVARIGRAAIEAWDRDAVPPPGWKIDAEARIEGWQQLLEAAAAYRNTLVVTSNGAARFVFQTGINIDGIPDSLKLRTGAFGLLIPAERDRWRVIDWDRRP